MHLHPIGSPRTAARPSGAVIARPKTPSPAQRPALPPRPTIERHIVELIRIREEAGDAAAALIDLLDKEDADPDLEPYVAGGATPGGSNDDREADDERELDEDFELSLGACERHPHPMTWDDSRVHRTTAGSQLMWGRGGLGGDVEDEHDGREPEADNEPWLGAPERPARHWTTDHTFGDQTGWAISGTGDGEGPDADREPSLSAWGSQDGTDREEDRTDFEPSLSAAECHPNGFDGFHDRNPTGSQLRWGGGSDRDHEEEHDGREPEDDEPSIGWTSTEANLGNYAESRLIDAEGEHDGCEPDDEGVEGWGQPARRRPDQPRLKTTLHPDELPAIYAMVVAGDCMEPLFSDGATLLFERDAPCVPGDLIALWRRPEIVKPGHTQALIKRLIAVTPDEVRVEMLNPPTALTFKRSDLLGMHRCKGEMPADQRGHRLTDDQIRSVAAAERARQ